MIKLICDTCKKEFERKAFCFTCSKKCQFDRFRRLRIGHPVSEETRKKVSDKLKEYFVLHPQRISEEQKKQISSTLKGHSTNEETRRKIAASLTGKSWITPEGRVKKSIRFSGSKNPNWKGGGWEMGGYPAHFFSVRKVILQRDSYTCQNEECLGSCKKLAVHHIDHNRYNNDPINLITLCISCNAREESKKRDYQLYYTSLMKRIHPEYCLVGQNFSQQERILEG
jgi:hypothetical protein